MKKRSPAILDSELRRKADHYLACHRGYQKRGHKRTHAAATTTKILVSVQVLVTALPVESNSRHVPHAASTDYRAVITATARRAGKPKFGRKTKKRARKDAYIALRSRLDFLDA